MGMNVKFGLGQNNLCSYTRHLALYKLRSHSTVIGWERVVTETWILLLRRSFGVPPRGFPWMLTYPAACEFSSSHAFHLISRKMPSALILITDGSEELEFVTPYDGEKCESFTVLNPESSILGKLITTILPRDKCSSGRGFVSILWGINLENNDYAV